MKYINNFFLFFFMFNIILLSNSFFLQAMEEGGQVEQDWGYKKREGKSLCCFDDRDERAYPYFLSDKNDSNAKVSEQKIIKKYNKTFGDSCDISSLNEENKKTLWYVLETIKKNEKLRIEGRDKYFSQTMSQRVLNLPLKIRQKIAAKCGKNMMSNRHYESSRLDAIWDDEDHKKFCAYLVESCGISCYCVLRCCSLKVLNPHILPALILYFLIKTFSCGNRDLYAVMKDWLKETPEEKDRRHGFETISLLQEMECEIVDSKEKQD